MSLNRRLGRFYIPLSKLEYELDYVAQVMKNVVVVEVRFDCTQHSIECLAMGEDFEIIPDGDFAIPYEVDWETGKFNAITLKMEG